MGSSSYESPKPFTIAIVGGGIGGVSLALGLAAQSVPFHIYESAPSFGEIGAGVTFGPNVIRALHGISPAMLRAYAKHVTTNEPPELADTFLTYRRGYLPNGNTDNLEKYASWVPEKIFNLVGKVQHIDGMKFPVRCSVHRAKLLDELVRLIPEGTVSFGKSLVSIQEKTEQGEEGVVLSFADGSTAVASAVVGCDGIKSTTRKHLHGPEARAEYAGLFGYRAMAPRAEFEKVLGKEIAATGNHFLCWNGYTIAYPVEHGAALNMFATCVKPGGTWEDEEWKIPSTSEELTRDTQGWHPGVVELLIKHGNGQKWAMFHSPHDQPYSWGRICLLGDAAHATTPHMGAGAGLAIEDSFILSRLLGSIRDPEDTADVFRAYDAVRRPRTQEFVRESKHNVTRYIALSGAVGDELKRLRDESHEKFGRLFEFDLDRSLREAYSILEQRRTDIKVN